MWPVKKVDSEEKVNELAQQVKLPIEVTRALYLRGHKTPEDIEKFLEISFNNLYPFESLPDIKSAIERINNSLKLNTPILIWGHEDLDGITSVIILAETIKDLGGQVFFYIPTKGKEPHGINVSKALEFKNQGVDLIITVDCGITNFNEIAELHQKGIDVIVADHHEVLEKLPPALANIDPKRSESNYPFDQLAACGIAFKLAWALYHNLQNWSINELIIKKPEFLIYATLGTIADRVPLVNENRILVKTGLQLIYENNKAIIKALLRKINTNNPITTERIINEIVPLFSAANGNEACSYFLSSNEDEIGAWLNKLQEESQAWRTLAKENYQLAEKIAQITNGIIIIKDENLSLKTLGYIAGRFKDQYQLPTVVLGKKNSDWVAECRGINGVDLVKMLKDHSNLLISFGGHKKACGFTITDNNLNIFIEKIIDYAEKNFVDKIIKEDTIVADAILAIRDLPLEVLKKFPPFGEGNPSPIFISKDTAISVNNKGAFFIERPELTVIINSDKITSKVFEIYPERVFANVLYTLNETGEIIILNLEYPH